MCPNVFLPTNQLVRSRCELIVPPFVHFLQPRESHLSTSRPRGQLLQEYFNVNAFVANPTGTFGDMGRIQNIGIDMITVDSENRNPWVGPCLYSRWGKNNNH
jgi:hypothetical protein